MTFNYESWIKQAKDRLALLYEQKNALDNEIASLERGIEGFLPLAKGAWLGPSAGITESIRTLMSSKPNTLFTPVNIRDGLVLKGVALKQKNAMATIHQVLSRLVWKDVVKVTVDKGKNYYRWVGEGGKDDVMKLGRLKRAAERGKQ